MRAEKAIVSPWLVSASMPAERGTGCYDARTQPNAIARCCRRRHPDA